MGSTYPDRPAALNKEKITGVRLDPSQRERLEEYATAFNTSLSALVREAVTIWLNMNTRGGK